MIRVHSTCASGASAIGVPGCPEFAFCTASIARPRITLIPRCSRSSATSAPFIHRIAAYVYPPRASGSFSEEKTEKTPVSGSETSVFENGDAGREAVQKITAADRPELARTERAGERHRPDHLLDDAGVVIRFGEHVATATVAREQERGIAAETREQRSEVFVGRISVAHLELHGRADL